MRRLVAMSAYLVGSLVVSAGFAQSTPPAAPDASGVSAPATGDALAEARVAFQEGTRLAKQARWVDALQAFEHSEALHPHAITTYNIGYCERLLGHWTRARKMLQKALADHKARGEVELPPDLVSATQAFLSEADRQIARVLVTITTEGGGALAVDGRPLELSDAQAPRPVLVGGTRAMGPAEVPPTPSFEVELDPGDHVFLLVSRGRPDVLVSQTLPPGSQAVLELRQAGPENVFVPKAVASDSERATAPKPNRVPAYVVLGMGAAGIATGTVAGLLAFGKKGAVSSACGPNGDLATCDVQRDAQARAADVSTVGFLAGGVGVAVGTVLFFTAPGRQSPKSASALAQSQVRPWVGWRSLGVQGDF
jgi:hypothetical protein